MKRMAARGVTDIRRENLEGGKAGGTLEGLGQPRNRKLISFFRGGGACKRPNMS